MKVHAGSLVVLLAMASLAPLSAVVAGSSGCDLPIAASSAANIDKAGSFGKPGDTTTHTLVHNGLTRHYSVHLPPAYIRGAALPLVLNIHGYTGNAREQEVASRMSAHADRNGYIVVYPQGTGFTAGDQLITSWNDMSCNASPGPAGSICADEAFDYPKPPECSAPDRCDWCTCHDDLGFIDAMLDVLETQLCIDTNRVYATGMSNGGMFVHRLGCNLGARFAAIAPVAGPLARGFGCAPQRLQKLGLMQIHGTSDDVVSYDGSASPDGFLYESLRDVAALWASPLSQDCSTATSAYPTNGDGIREFRCTQHADCATGAEVVSCLWDAAHVLPVSKEAPQFGNDVVWSFFQRHRRDGRDGQH